MSHPGLSSPHLADMRRVLDEMPLSDRDRRAVQAALADIETHWTTKHQESYKAGVAERDRLHGEVVQLAEQFQGHVTEAIDDVRNGRRSPAEIRAALREVHTNHQRLTEQHHGIAAREDGLAEYEAMSPEEYQADQFQRFSPIIRAAPTLAAKVAEHSYRPPAVPRQSQEQADADQDALVNALGGRTGLRRPSGWSS